MRRTGLISCRGEISFIKYINIYQSNRYPFLRALIGSRNSQNPRLLVDFEAEVKMKGNVHTKNIKKVYIVLFL